MKTKICVLKTVNSALAAIVLLIAGSVAAHAQYVDLITDNFDAPQAPNPAEHTFTPGNGGFATSTLTDSSTSFSRYTGLNGNGDGSTFGLEEESTIGADGGSGLSIFTTSAANEAFGGTTTAAIALDATPGQVTGDEIRNLEFLLNFSLTNDYGFTIWVNPSDASGNQLAHSQNIQFFYGSNSGNSDGNFSLADFNLSAADYQTFADQMNAAGSIYISLQVLDTFNGNGNASVNISNLEIRQYGVPEPPTWALLVVSAAGLVFLGGRRAVLR